MASDNDQRGEPSNLGHRGVRARRQARRVRRFYTLTAASTVVPGLGLLPTRRRTGTILVAGFVACLVAVCAYGLIRGMTSSLISVGVSRPTLLLLIAVIVLVVAAWIWGIITTARDNYPEGTDGRPKVAMLAFVALAAVLVLAPAAQTMRYAVIQRSVLDTVFDSVRPDGAAAPGEGDDPWAGTDRVNIMLVGSDAAETRFGVRPDALMVASIDPQTGEAVLFGIPRNLQDIPFSEDNPLSEVYPQGYSCGSGCLMEYVWTLGREHKDLFDNPNPGLTATRDAASQVLGLDIGYTAVVNLDGFKQLVDAMGGVTINVKERICIGCHVGPAGNVIGTTGYIEPGVQELDGYRALWYARSRAGSKDGDFSRMRRQRCMVGALLNQVEPTSMLVRYPALADTLKDNVRVDIPQEDLSAWAALVLRVQEAGEIRSLPLTNENIDISDPDYAKIHGMVQEALHPPEPTKKPTSSSSSATTKTPLPSEEPTPSETPSTSKDQLADIAATC